MSIERTLSIIKPDATKRNITGKIMCAPNIYDKENHLLQ